MTRRFPNLNMALHHAESAARAAGRLMRKHWRSEKKVRSSTQHDIKLELDERCQSLIERKLRAAYRQIPILGEEGVVGAPKSDLRWVVDPIDGTVNYAHGIPHCCVSIALQGCREPRRPRRNGGSEPYSSMVGVVYDPFCQEVWTAIHGERARLNGRPIRVSARRRLEECIISVGFAKYRATLQQMLPVLNRLLFRARKVRIMGSAALALTYVASGRTDAYVEAGLRLWDIAAGGLILECAGGDFWHRPMPGEHVYHVAANNGLLRRKLLS